MANFIGDLGEVLVLAEQKQNVAESLVSGVYNVKRDAYVHTLLLADEEGVL